MTKFSKKIAVVAAFLGALTIGTGAFGAHGLEKLADADAVASFETGVRYQMYHAIALLVLGLWGGMPDRITKQISWLWLSGIVLFSFSIYLLALDEAMGSDLSALGPVTPVGGLLLLAGWVRLGVGLLTLRIG